MCFVYMALDVYRVMGKDSSDMKLGLGRRKTLFLKRVPQLTRLKNAASYQNVYNSVWTIFDSENALENGLQTASKKFVG